jgi:hypothetical protein
MCLSPELWGVRRNDNNDNNKTAVSALSAIIIDKQQHVALILIDQSTPYVKDIFDPAGATLKLANPSRSQALRHPPHPSFSLGIT